MQRWVGGLRFSRVLREVGLFTDVSEQYFSPIFMTLDGESELPVCVVQQPRNAKIAAEPQQQSEVSQNKKKKN
jgi:hypothetical protein